MKDVGDTLHRLERLILPLLAKPKDLHEITQASRLKDIEVRRALQWLENKKLITTTEESEELISLDTNGVIYQREGLPERRALQALAEKGTLTTNELPGIAKEELNIIIGTLKSKAAIDISKKEGALLISITTAGKKLLERPFLEETFLQGTFPKKPASLSGEERYAYEQLKKRQRLISTQTKKTIQATATKEGLALIKRGISTQTGTDHLTPEMIRTGAWKTQHLRPYDVSINVPTLPRGKQHFANEATQYAKRIWLDMGFVEMRGKHVQTAFWDLDALFVPQDHPAREMQDTFYLTEPAKGTVKDEALFLRVQKVHEDGADTGSKGWRTPYSKALAMLNLLRTHTTVLSAHKLTEIDRKDLPLKFFTIGKVYRNESLDWKHLFEFHQVDGIVIDQDANLRHLKGYLEEFYKKMGYPKVRMRPAHFPYTEPSIEVEVWHPQKKEWIEMGGAGIFRPEVTKTLIGEEIPVLAWGLGLERIIAPYYGITDIRDIYRNDLKQLRTIKAYTR